MRAQSARMTTRLAVMILAACLLLPVLGGAIFMLAVQQRIIAAPELHANLVLVRIDTARVVLPKCSAPPMFCMPQDDHEADQDIYTVRVSVYTAPHSPPMFIRQVMAVRLQPKR